MFTKLKHQWNQLRRSPPGERFQQRYDRHPRHRPGNHSSTLRRIAVIGSAALLAAVGLVLVFIPGPAILFFFIAGALLAGESRGMARAFDWTELRLRHAWASVRRWWKKHSTNARVPLFSTVALFVAASVTLPSLMLP